MIKNIAHHRHYWHRAYFSAFSLAQQDHSIPVLLPSPITISLLLLLPWKQAPPATVSVEYCKLLQRSPGLLCELTALCRLRSWIVLKLNVCALCCWIWVAIIWWRCVCMCVCVSFVWYRTESCDKMSKLLGEML